MNTYWPDYCQQFRCKADRCLHTCCAGWAICIDEVSLARFEKDPEVAGKISDGCFTLKDDGRCPFLRDDNLCEMILTRGEDYLCDICKEHPRFYNTYEDRIEAGIGLVCEEACRLALGFKTPFTLAAENGSKRDLPPAITAVLDSSKPLTERLSLLSCGRRANPKLRAEIFAQMEVMDPEWSLLLGKVIEDPVAEADEDKAVSDNSGALANFAAYLLYRHKGAGRFAAEAVYLLADLTVKGCDIYEAARLFSGEVEYSDINIETALDTFN